MKTDAQLIDELGGSAKVASMLGYKPEIGIQRVHNWKARGIPAAVRLKHIDIFGIPPEESKSNQQDAA